MSTAESTASPGRMDPGTAGRWSGAAFGLEIDSPVVLDGLIESSTAGGRRRTTVELVPPKEIERAWRSSESSTLLERRHRDGSLMMVIDVHPELGYRIWAPRHGRHLVRPDGRRILSALPRVARWRWQRLLFAQVLPLAAVLQGVELFHASAVELGGRALGFIAASGTGKTSIAVHLVAQDASLLTDDVLALEPSPEGILAYPGGGLVNVPVGELSAVPPARRGRIGVVLGRSDKVHLAARLADRPHPLRSIYFLRRGDRFATVRIAASAPQEPPPLLQSGFIAYVRSPERLRRHLDVCSRIATHVAAFDVDVPATYPAAEVAASIRAHAGTAP